MVCRGHLEVQLPGVRERAGQLGERVFQAGYDSLRHSVSHRSGAFLGDTRRHLQQQRPGSSGCAEGRGGRPAARIPSVCEGSGRLRGWCPPAFAVTMGRSAAVNGDRRVWGHDGRGHSRGGRLRADCRRRRDAGLDPAGHQAGRLAGAVADRDRGCLRARPAGGSHRLVHASGRPGRAADRRHQESRRRRDPGPAPGYRARQ